MMYKHYKYIYLSLIFICFNKAYSQRASSANYILRTSNTNEAHSIIGSSSFNIVSSNFALTSSIGEDTVSLSTQSVSSSYKLDVGFTPTWNLPPKVVTNLNFPESGRYLYTSRPPFLFVNAGDWDYSSFNINDKLNFELQISTNTSFTSLTYLANTRGSTTNWYTTSSPNNCLYSQTLCNPFPSIGVDSTTGDSIKHIMLTDLPLGDYYWKIKAFDDFEFSEDSSTPLLHYILPVVFTLTPNNNQIINDTSATLSWQQPLGGNKYQIQISRNCSFSDAQDYFIDAPSLSLHLSNLQDGRYCWRIRPFDILGNPSGYTTTLVFYIVTIPVLGVKLIAEFYVVPPETEILLRAYLIGPQDQVISIITLDDIDISLIGKNPPGDMGLLFDKRLYSDRIEITYKSPLSAGITSIKAKENRSGKSYTDTISIGTFGKLLLLEGQYNPKNVTVKVGEEVVIASFKFWAVSENIKLNDIYITLPPVKASKTLSKLKLVEDINNDGKFTEGIDRLIISIQRSEFDPLTNILPKIVELLPRNIPINYLLLGTFNKESTDGDFYIDFIPENVANSWGLISNVVIPAEGLPFRAGPFIVKSNQKNYECKWSTAFANFSARKFNAPINNFQAMHFLVSSLDVPCSWNNPLIRISGSGIDNTQISRVILVEDVNGSGLYESSTDRILATGNFSQDDGILSFPVSISLAANMTKYYFVLIDFINSTNNAYYRLYFKKNEQSLSVNGTSARFTGNDFLYGSLLTNVTNITKGFLNIFSNTQSATSKILKPNNINQVMNLYLYNSNLEAVNFKELKVILTVDPLLTIFINYAYLYQDLNMNGRIDIGSDLLLDKRLFVQDGSILPSVKFSNFNVNIGISEYKSFIVAFELSTAYNVTINMRTIIANSDSLFIVGSPAPDIDGTPVTSNQLLLEKFGETPPPPPAPIPQISSGGGGGCYVKPNFPNDNNRSNMDFLFTLITSLPLIYIVLKLSNAIMLKGKWRKIL